MPTPRQVATVRNFTEAGIHLFPQDKNKRPTISEWPETATCDYEQIAKWSKQFPKCNWAALCGDRSGIFVIDIDVKGGEDGLTSWAEFVNGREVKTMSVRTPSGGRHLYFKWNDSLDFTKIQDLLPGVEAIGNRQCATIPGSFYASGGEYVVENDEPISEAPNWIIEKIIAYKTSKRRAPSVGDNGSHPPGTKVQDGERTQFLLSQAGRFRSLGLGRDQIFQKLVQVFNDRCIIDPPLRGGTEEKIAGIADSYCRYPAGSTTASWTDLANSRRFSGLSQDQLLYCDPHAQWYYYNGKKWAEDRQRRVYAIAKGMIRELYHEASGIADDRERKSFAKGILSLETKNRINAMVDLAKDDLSVIPEDLDSNPNLLNVLNGVLDLENNRLIAHSPDHKITKISTVEFRRDAECPKWLTHLSVCFQDDMDLIKYFQKLVGYTLSGSTAEQVFIFIYGAGETGKSTTLNIVENLLGDYAVRTAVETFLQQNNADHPANLYALSGSRFILAQEPGKGRRWNESRIKEMSGERKIAARKMRSDWEEIAITGKIWISSNNKPRVDDSSGFWRRIKLMPFDHAITEEDRILDYDKEIWDEESEGILNWALRGYSLWKTEGLKDTPEKVQHAIAGYRDDSDVLKEFIDSKLKKKPGSLLGAMTLYDSYKSWALDSGLKCFSNKRFPSELEEHGCTRKRTQNGMFWVDLELKA